MENKKQTAVEWLIEQLIPEDQHEGIMDIIEQAKEIEEYQILDSFVEGSRFKVDIAQSTPDGIEPEVMRAVDYYNNIYSK
jgi:hypothetical protein